MKSEKRYRIKSNFILRKIGGEYAIVPVDAEDVLQNAVLEPNDTAVFIWQAFQEPATIEEATEKTEKEFDAPAEVIRNAVHRFVEESLRLQILEEAK